MRRIVISVAVAFLGALAVGSAQTKPLVNEDVVKMVQAGLGEDIIAAAVNAAPATDFVLTPDSLIKLKSAKVSDKVIDAMISSSVLTKSAAILEVARIPESEVTIPDGTEVRLRLIQRMSSATAKVNDTVRFEVMNDVAVGGRTVIAAGASATGTVVEAAPKRSFGRSGKLNFTIDAVKAVDDDNIRLRSTKENQGDNSFGKAGVVGLLAGPFAGFVRGKDVEIETGTEYTIYIDGDRRISLGR